MWTRLDLPWAADSIAPRHLLRVAAWLAFSLAGAAGGAAADDPDPIALLRGVEAARAAIPPSRLEMTIRDRDPKKPKRGEIATRLTIVFSGANRRFEQDYRALTIDGSGPDGGRELNARLQEMEDDREAFVRAGLGKWKDMNTRSAFDGGQLMRYDAGAGTQITDPSKGSGDYMFDPRTLGISVWFDITTNVANYLGYRDAKAVDLIGEEEVEGHRAWHVRVSDKRKQEKHFWIGDAPGYLVYKSELIGGNSRWVLTSEMAGAGEGNPLPVKVVAREYGQDGALEHERVFTLDRAAYDVAVNPNNWTVAGLGMAVGETVTDVRIHRVIGHWDGEGLTESYTKALAKSRANRSAQLRWRMLATGPRDAVVGATAVAWRIVVSKKG